jgi:sulfotransferase family protein
VVTSRGKAESGSVTEAAAAPSGAVPGGGESRARNSPIIILSYFYSGADYLQQLLSSLDGLACTQGTGIVPLCAAAAETWRRVEGEQWSGPSRLALTSVRSLITAQITATTTRLGKTRWCELATAAPSAAGAFRRFFPQSMFICAHRSCVDVIRAGALRSPWGLVETWSQPYARAYPGNTLAALAAYWIESTEQLLEFESDNPEGSLRIRYEDVAASPQRTLELATRTLGLNEPGTGGVDLFSPGLPDPGKPPADVQGRPQSDVLVEMIPLAMQKRITVLHAKLGYDSPF